MDWLDKMNGAMNYIEDNLTTEIDYWEIARSACCSEYHLRRMFPFITGVSLSEYIRRRRLSLAAFELNSNNIAVRDVATKYGYSSPDAFTRAFKNWHGITPSDARKHGEQLKAYPRMIFHLSIEGGVEMNYRIEEKNTFNIVGIMKRVPIVFEGPNPEIESMWKELDEQQLARLKELSNVDPKGIISASTNFSEGRMEEEGELDHYIGVATTNKAGDNFAQLTVPVSTWAVFESIGSFPETLQETWGRIYSEWFPTSNYELAKGPEMLWNENNDTDSATFKSEIWIPVSEK